MMHITDIATADLDALNEELSAAGRESTHTEIGAAREGVARLLWDMHPKGHYDLHDSETGDVIRPATEDEMVASVAAGSEGHIMVDGRRCYVA